MHVRFSGLWRHKDFLKLWLGESISLLGSQVSTLALPLTAVLTLQATPAQLGLLGAAQYAPMLLLSLFAGVWLDRVRRRPIMLAANLAQVFLIGSVPLFAVLHMLSIALLCGIAFLTGCCAVLFGVAYQSYLPSLIGPEHIFEGNSKLEASQAVAEIGGPALAGAIVQLFTAPVALLIDAVSFLISALCLGAIRQHEAAPARRDEHLSVWKQLLEGWELIGKNPALRAIVGSSSCLNCFDTLMFTVYTLYVIRDLQLSAALLGTILALGSLGGLLGALIAVPLGRRIGIGPALIWSCALMGAGSFLVPLAQGPLLVVLPLLFGARLLVGVLNPIYNINQLSVRQVITPTHLRGRVNATVRFLAGGSVPIGALLAGVLGSALGIRTTLWIGAAGMSLAFLWLWFSPLRSVRTFFERE